MMAGVKHALPPPSQRVFALRALKTLALADGELHPQERRLLEIAADAMGFCEGIESLEPIEPVALAEGLTDLEARVSLMQRLVILSTLDAEVSEAEVDLLERFGDALGVDERAVHNLRQLVEGHVFRMAFDLGRRSFLPTKLRSIWSERGLTGLWELAKPMLGVPDPELAARFEALGALPGDTFGYALFHQFVDNGFAYPGQRFGGADSILFHDAGHVLAGYDTSPAGELKVAGFQAGYMDEDGLAMFLMIASLFQLGIEELARARRVKAEKGMLDVDSFREAYARGRAMNTNLLTWDPWPSLERPLEEVRAELGVPPLAAE